MARGRSRRGDGRAVGLAVPWPCGSGRGRRPHLVLGFAIPQWLGCVRHPARRPRPSATRHGLDHSTVTASSGPPRRRDGAAAVRRSRRRRHGAAGHLPKPPSRKRRSRRRRAGAARGHRAAEPLPADVLGPIAAFKNAKQAACSPSAEARRLSRRRRGSSRPRCRGWCGSAATLARAGRVGPRRAARKGSAVHPVAATLSM